MSNNRNEDDEIELAVAGSVITRTFGRRGMSLGSLVGLARKQDTAPKRKIIPAPGRTPLPTTDPSSDPSNGPAGDRKRRA